MKKIALLVGTVVFAGLQIAEADTAGASAGADIIPPLMVMAWEELDFGTIVPGTDQSGEVSLSPAAERTCLAPLSCPRDDAQPARFAIGGETGRVFTVGLPASIELENETGSTMTAHNLVSAPESGVISAGKAEFLVGGTLTVSSSQPVGVYTGTYTVTVEYQ